MLPEIEEESYTEDKNILYYGIKNPKGFIFLCACEKSVPRSSLLIFVQHLQSEWYKFGGENVTNFEKYHYNDSFGKEKIKFFIDSSNSERKMKFDQIIKNTEEALDTSADNLVKAYERGEHLDAILPKAENIEKSAKQFHEEAKKKRREMFWQKWKWYFVAAAIIIILIIIIVIVVVKC